MPLSSVLVASALQTTAPNINRPFLLRQLEAMTEQHLDVARLACSIEAVCEKLRSGLEQATFEQRALVELLIDCIVVSDAEVEIRYLIPLSRAGLHRRFCHLRLDCRGGVSQPLRDLH